MAIREARQQAYGASRFLPHVTPLAQAPEDVIQAKLISVPGGNRAVEQQTLIINPRFCTSRAICSPQSGHELSMRPSTSRAAQMPNAFHAQLPYHQRPAARTRWTAGTAESGFAMRISFVAIFIGRPKSG